MAEDQVPRLSEICSKTFLFLTTFRRSFRTVEMDGSWVHDRLLEIFDEQKKIAEGHPQLFELYEKARYLLVVTADGVILNSEWPSAQDWSLLELEYYGMAQGGEKFFEYLKKDPAYRDEQLLEVFYLCLSVGFQGMYISSPEELEEIRQGLFLRLKGIPHDTGELVTPQAYEETIQKDLTVMPVFKLLRFGIVLAGLLVLMLGLIWITYEFGIEEVIELAEHISNGDYNAAVKE